LIVRLPSTVFARIPPRSSALVPLLAVLASAVAGPALAEQRPSFATRVEPRFGESPFYFSIGDWRAKRGRWTDLRSGERKLAANFVVEDGDVPVAILFAAEAYVDVAGKRMFARLLVDGEPMSPSDVVLVNGDSGLTQSSAFTRRAAQSFEFTAKLDRGLHTVEAQWLVDPGATGYVRQAGLLVRQGDVDLTRGALRSATPPSGRSVHTATSSWQAVPGLDVDIRTSERDCLTATVSGEAYASSGKSGWLRVTIDGLVAEPGSVEFANGGFEGSRSMVFGQCDLPAGDHSVRAEWHAEAGGSAWFGDRTLTVAALPTGNSDELRGYFAHADNVVAAPDAYGPMPGMSQNVLVAPNSEIAVVLGVEFAEPPSGEVYARLVVHGQVVKDSEVLLANDDTNAGVHAFVFNAKHVRAGQSSSLGPVAIEWMSKDGEGSEIRSRGMSVQVQPQVVPDLATPPPFGGLVAGARVEPVRGAHDVLVVLFDPDRPGHPAPSISDLTQAFAGASDSIADYYRTVSGDRFTLNVVGVLGPYAAAFPAGHYWNGPGTHQDKWVEALEQAEDQFDFAKYDRDGDGYVHPWRELAVVIVVPQTNSVGTVAHLWHESGDTPQTFDGVHIELITEWYSSDPVLDYMVGAHELGHQILFLADLYGKNYNSQTDHGTRPGRLSLMDLSPSDLTSHLDGPSKLALGWVNPRFIRQDDTYTLEDVKTGGEVLVLPRRPGGAADEYLVIENRQDAADNSRYDAGLWDSGLAVWHLIEGDTDNDPIPPCTSESIWSGQAGNDNHRQGIRLLRPAIVYSDVDALWSSEHDDFDAFGLTCPVGGAAAHNALVWADGSPSYELREFSASGPNMSLDIVVP
jgi:M6 family metalloprotease-like protein